MKLPWPFSPRALDPVIRALQDRWLHKAAQIHSAFFARAWGPADFTELLVDQSVVADGLFDGTGQKLLGFALSRKVAPEAELLSIAIDSGQQGRGLGKSLLRAHLSRLASQEIQEIFLEVEQENVSAISLYRSFGFVTVGERTGYYQKKDGSRATALVMRASLT